MLQSARPIEDNEKRPSSGGVKVARATVIARARSGPNQGLACAPRRGLRVVGPKGGGRTPKVESTNPGPNRRHARATAERERRRGRCNAAKCGSTRNRGADRWHAAIVHARWYLRVG